MGVQHRTSPLSDNALRPLHRSISVLNDPFYLYVCCSYLFSTEFAPDLISNATEIHQYLYSVGGGELIVTLGMSVVWCLFSSHCCRSCALH